MSEHTDTLDQLYNIESKLKTEIKQEGGSLFGRGETGDGRRETRRREREDGRREDGRGKTGDGRRKMGDGFSPQRYEGTKMKQCTPLCLRAFVAKK